MNAINIMEAEQELRSPRGEVSLILSARDLREDVGPTIIVRQKGRAAVAGYDDALRLGIADDLLLDDDHLTWLCSQRQAVDEWTATWERMI